MKALLGLATAAWLVSGSVWAAVSLERDPRDKTTYIEQVEARLNAWSDAIDMMRYQQEEVDVTSPQHKALEKLAAALEADSADIREQLAELHISLAPDWSKYHRAIEANFRDMEQERGKVARR